MWTLCQERECLASRGKKDKACAMLFLPSPSLSNFKQEVENPNQIKLKKVPLKETDWQVEGRMKPGNPEEEKLTLVVRLV